MELLITCFLWNTTQNNINMNHQPPGLDTTPSVIIQKIISALTAGCGKVNPHTEVQFLISGRKLAERFKDKKWKEKYSETSCSFKGFYSGQNVSLCRWKPSHSCHISQRALIKSFDDGDWSHRKHPCCRATVKVWLSCERLISGEIWCIPVNTRWFLITF